jgi:hypothetical protein
MVGEKSPFHSKPLNERQRLIAPTITPALVSSPLY